MSNTTQYSIILQLEDADIFCLNILDDLQKAFGFVMMRIWHDIEDAIICEEKNQMYELEQQGKMWHPNAFQLPDDIIPDIGRPQALSMGNGYVIEVKHKYEGTPHHSEYYYILEVENN